MRPAEESEREIRRLLNGATSLFVTCWSRLGIPQSSDTSTVTTAYRRLSLLVHPDKAPNELSSQAHEAFGILSQAFQQALKVAPAPRTKGGASGSSTARDKVQQPQQASNGADSGGWGTRRCPATDLFSAGSEWWKDKKSWEIEEMLRKFEDEIIDEVRESIQKGRVRKDERTARRKKRESRLVEEQEQWLERAQEGAEQARSSWAAFVSQNRTTKRSRQDK